MGHQVRVCDNHSCIQLDQKDYLYTKRNNLKHDKVRVYLKVFLKIVLKCSFWETVYKNNFLWF